MLNDLMGYDHGLFSLMEYGDDWRKHRRVFRQHFNPSALTEYRPIIQHQLSRFLAFLLDSPDKFHTHCETYMGSVILHITYGYPALVEDDPFIADGEDVLKAFRIAGLPGSFLVDVFPFLKYVPSWFPGAGFKGWAADYRAKETSARHQCFRYSVDAMKGGSQTTSVASQLISKFSNDDASEREEQERVARNVTFIAYIVVETAGLDTAHAMSTIFILAMAMYPEGQRKAQKEVDRVIGSGRLPTVGDQEETLYIQALILELFRWHQVTPLVIPHSITSDIYYDGYTIPKGTIVMGNAWAVLHDPEVFENPMEFIPERYIKDGKINTDLPDPSKFVFGFGRRSCPGRHLGLEMLYMMIVSTLLLFDILPPEDELGNPKKVEATFNDGIT
ncbi:hypothetical protein EST38_g10872 [Candolleomyces aberdarensis]|uniref:Cytochrome P450 n=1 Tax=Candolleomyces aberdarensis TaxID=2316362 RepID=A0A4Q2D8Q4_9AGAR|nr:hypothetical protein EST38_g10872 [Candolleomyces aberdarensis]